MMDGPIRAPDRGEVIQEKPPLAYSAAVRALAGCFMATARLVGQRRMHLPSQRVGMRLRFADGTSARVFRETVVDRGATVDPCVLVLVSVRGSIHYVVLPGLRRDVLLAKPEALEGAAADAAAWWWRLAEAG